MTDSTLRTFALIAIAIGLTGFAAAQGREPTKGYIPENAFEDGRFDLELVPDYIVVYTRSGEVAGYIRKTDYFVLSAPRAERIEVVDETLSRTVGSMVRNRGFVPLGTPEDEIPETERQAGF